MTLSPLSLFSAPNSTLSLQVIAATNRSDILGPALLRSGRLDHNIEFPFPNNSTCARILEIHSCMVETADGYGYDE